MTGGQLAPTTPQTARTTTSLSGNSETPFNIPYLAAASGASYIARWTAAHVPQLERGITEALSRRGFSFVEVLSPCPTYYGRMNRQPSGLAQMNHYRDNSVVQHGADPSKVGVGIDGQVIVGKFVDIELPYIPSLEGRGDGR
jgi:2-oxoglutarate ferredoxin oxidoreductase subunit beta